MARPEIGDEAPDFELPWTGEGSFELSGRRGRWVVLAFYPGDFTSVCTKQFCNYRDGRDVTALRDALAEARSPALA